MIIGITGYLTETDNPFINGYIQNIIFFCKFINKYFSNGNEIIPINSDDFLEKYNKIDIIIQFTPLSSLLSDLVKSKYPYCRNIFVKYGHEYYNDLHRLLPKGQNDIIPSPKAYNIDEVWISPHFESTKYYYQTIYNNAKVRIIPYIWKPYYLSTQPYKQLDYNNCIEKNIYIIEPNINLFKTALIPILIVNELWKKKPDCFNKLYIIGDNNYNNNEYFNNQLLPKIGILNSIHNKAYFCNRASIDDIFTKPGILLSHQENWGLNYIYLEALYLKIQWVHNSPFFKGNGYYYEDKNIYQGVEKLEQALKEWKSIDNSNTIDKYNYDNEFIINKYKKIIMDIFENV